MLILHDRLKLDPQKNHFPVTLHDPCNIVRLMGIVEPQRHILKKDLSPIQRDGAPRFGKLLLRWGERFCDHEIYELQGMEKKHLQPNEVEKDPGNL